MGYTWDEQKRRYRDDDGVLVRPSTVRKWVDAMTEALALVFIARADRFRQEPSPELYQIWNHQTRLDLSSLHYAAMMIAFGGQAQMTPSRWSDAEAIILAQMGYWDRFSTQVIMGDAILDGTFPIRTSLYAFAAYATHEEGVRLRETAHNQYEKRIITSSRPCHTCIDEAGKGWQPIGTGRRIGDTICLTRDRCYFIFGDNPDA